MFDNEKMTVAYEIIRKARNGKALNASEFDKAYDTLYEFLNDINNMLDTLDNTSGTSDEAYEIREAWMDIR